MGAVSTAKNSKFRILHTHNFDFGGIFMKKSSVVGIVIAALAVIGVVVALCIYMKELRKLWNSFWDKLQAKRSNLQIYMD